MTMVVPPKKKRKVSKAVARLPTVANPPKKTATPNKKKAAMHQEEGRTKQEEEESKSDSLGSTKGKKL